MKTNLFARVLLRSSIFAAMTGVIMALFFCDAEAADPDGQQLREKIERLQQEARDLKAEGKPERAEMLMRQAEELRAQAEKQKRSAQGDNPRLAELKRELARARGELAESRAAGKQAEVNKLQRHIEELQLALDRSQESPAGRARPVREPMPRREGQEPGPDQPEMQRLRHLEVAIDNLHAAGMHEPAERLAQEAQAMRQNLRRGQGLSPGAGRPDQEIEQLRAELRELQQAVRQLRGRVEELTRDKR